MFSGMEYKNTALGQCPEGTAQDNFSISIQILSGGVIWCPVQMTSF
jgi:hypothetical protein